VVVLFDDGDEFIYTEDEFDASCLVKKGRARHLMHLQNSAVQNSAVGACRSGVSAASGVRLSKPVLKFEAVPSTEDTRQKRALSAKSTSAGKGKTGKHQQKRALKSSTSSKAQDGIVVQSNKNTLPRSFKSVWPVLARAGWKVVSGDVFSNWQYVLPASTTKPRQDRAYGVDFLRSEEEVVAHSVGGGVHFTGEVYLPLAASQCAPLAARRACSSSSLQKNASKESVKEATYACKWCARSFDSGKSLGGHLSGNNGACKKQGVLQRMAREAAALRPQVAALKKRQG
jgi:hypothetical protein